MPKSEDVLLEGIVRITFYQLGNFLILFVKSISDTAYLRVIKIQRYVEVNDVVFNYPTSRLRSFFA